MKTWIKLYTEINRDPDIGTLTWAQRGIWSALLALAGEIDDRDENEQETGRLDTSTRVAWSIRCDLAELDEAINEFEAREMLDIGADGILFLPNYPKRQCRPPSSRPSAVAERVKRHRARAKKECNDVTDSMQRGVTPSDTDTDTEAEAEERQRQTTDSRGETPAAAVAVILEKLNADMGITDPTAQRLIDRHLERGELPALMPRLNGWLAYVENGGKGGKDQFAHPVGFAISQALECRDPPATDNDRDPNWWAGTEWESVVES